MIKVKAKDRVWIPIPIDQIHMLTKGAYIRYTKRGEAKNVLCYVQGHWENKEDKIGGLTLSFKPYARDKSDRFTVPYLVIEELWKEVNPDIFFEYQRLLNMINS
jgi:hypothetical protein